MIINLDKFFVEEMNISGFDVNYSRLLDIYRKSRENPLCVARKARNAAFNAMFMESIGLGDNTNNEKAKTRKSSKRTNGKG